MQNGGSRDREWSEYMHENQLWQEVIMELPSEEMIVIPMLVMGFAYGTFCNGLGTGAKLVKT